MKKNADLSEYAESHDRCAVCHWRKFRPGKRLELHHIQGRRGENPHDHRNLILLCSDCHFGYHSGGKRNSIDMGVILEAKRQEDGEVDEPYLAGLRRRKAFPDLDRVIPDWAEAERIANRDK
jgi:hypothetical protein